MRRQFYEVKEPAYLFREKVVKEGTQDQPEERVRQWCAFELIRAYGVPVADIEFERQVKVGSKTYRIDILVSRNGDPWLVMECKQQEDSKPQRSMAQAISYADAQGIDAEFAACTNGDYWCVKRRHQNGWVAIPDLPRQQVNTSGQPLTRLLWGIDEMAPVLHKLDESLEGADAQRFLSALQRWFHGSSLLTEGVSDDILWGMDNLLRVLSQPDAHPNYLWGKLAAAAQGFDRWRDSIGFSVPLAPIHGGDKMYYEMQLLSANLLQIAETSADLPSGDERVLRVAVALLDYGRTQFRPKMKPHCPSIPKNVHEALRDFLNYSLAIHLDTKLPDPLDRISVAEVKECCSKAWEAMDQQPRTPFFVGLRMLVECALDWLCFWRRQ